MNMPYRYRGLGLLALLVVALPWMAWRFALHDTFAAWRECRRLERRLAQIDEELSESAQPQEQADLMERAQELLELKTLPRELAVALIERIEIGERDAETGEQKVNIVWKF